VFSFGAVSTDRIRVLVKGATSYGFSFVAEVAAWSASGGGGGNALPNVSLTSPSSGASYNAPASVTLAASASDSDGSVAKVEFFSGAIKVGESLSVPYSVTLSNVAAGAYTYTAVATDNVGATTTSASVSVTVVTSGGGGSATNVALASSGATASASSRYSANHPASAVIDGVRNSKDLGKGGVWVDGTGNQYPDWVQVNFAGVQTIDRIEVVTTADDIANTEPTQTTTFTKYGITSYEVQYWTGSAWVTVPGGAVTGNNLVWRVFSFGAVSTDRIRVLVKGATSYGFSFVAEVAAWTPQ
jgi:hypothetical protein